MNYDLIIKLNNMYNEIFPDDDRNLTNFEKRERIFNFLASKIKYDTELYEKIRTRKQNGERLKRDPYTEVMNVIDNNKGICNSIAQVYKLLLEMADIYSICIVCDYNTAVAHQINLVKTEDGYSFDDVTSAIIDSDSKEKYFNYDLEEAQSLKQGTKEIYNGMNFFGIKSVIIYRNMKLGEYGLAYSHVKDPEYDEKSYPVVLSLPSNIKKFDNSKFKR